VNECDVLALLGRAPAPSRKNRGGMRGRRKEERRRGEVEEEE